MNQLIDFNEGARALPLNLSPEASLEDNPEVIFDLLDNLEEVLL